MKRNPGTALILVSILLFVIDKALFPVSDRLAKLFCGDDYLKPVDGVFSETACGFDADMYFVAFLALIALTGAVMLLTAPQSTKTREDNP